MFGKSISYLICVCCLLGILLAGCSKKEDQNNQERPLSTAREPIVNSQTAVDTPEIKVQEEQPVSEVPSEAIEVESESSEETAVDPNSEVIKTLLKEAMTKIDLQDIRKQQGDRNHALEPNNIGSEQIQLAVETDSASELDDKSLKDPYSQSALHQEWTQCNTSEQKIELLESFWGVAEEPDAQVLSILEQALQDPDPEVGLSASELFSQCSTADVLPAIEQALLSGSDEVKINALEPLGGINDPSVASLLSMALEDPSESVRSEALAMADEQEGAIQLDTLAVGITSAYDDVKIETLSILEMRGDRASVPLILEGLNDPDQDFFEEVNSTLNFLVDQEFESYEQGVTWWQQNESRYDEDLFEK